MDLVGALARLGNFPAVGFGICILKPGVTMKQTGALGASASHPRKTMLKTLSPTRARAIWYLCNVIDRLNQSGSVVGLWLRYRRKRYVAWE